MSEPLASVQIDSSVVRSIVDSKIQAAVLAELSKTTDVLAGLVHAVITKKVTDGGSVSSYSYENRYNLIEVLCKQAIEKEVQAAIQEWVQNNSAAVRRQIAKELDKNELIKCFTGAIQNAISSSFYASCTVKIQPKDDR